MAARAGRCAAGAGAIGSFAADKRRCCGGGGGWPLRGGRGDDSGFPAARRSSPGERERARRPSRASIESGGVYAGCAAISSEGSLPPEKKLLPCSFRARKCAAFQRKLVGVEVAGELAPPSTSVFDKQREGRPSGLPSRLSMYASCGCAARRAGCQRLLCGVKPSPSASRTSVAITKACSSHSDMMRLSCSTSVR